MKWLGLSRTRRPPDPVAAPRSSTPGPAGIDYLRAQAGLSNSAGHGPTAPPSDPGMLAAAACMETLLDAAEQAEKSANWPEAERLWQTMRTGYPHIWYSYTGVATALCGLGRIDEASRLLADAAVRFPREHAICHERGRLAARQGDWPAAEAHWRAALTFEVRPWWVYIELATALCALGRIEDAWETLSDAAVQSPREPTIHHELGRLAARQGDWPAAEAHWRAALTFDPPPWWVYSELATALCALGRIEDARQVLSEAAARFPREHTIHHELGRLATRQGDWPAAEAHWRAALTFDSRPWWVYSELATALCAQGRIEDARQVLSEAAARFPREHTIHHELGRLVAKQGDWPAAEAHWRAALTFDSRPWWVYSELANALEQQGRLAEAEVVLLDGQTHDPSEVSLFTAYARLAWDHEDWSAAVARWAEARRRFPISEALSSGLYQALMRLAEHDPAAADAAHHALALSSADAAAEDAKRALLLRFESLGGSGPDGGCEFGGVQRERGAEPLGLFRWATVPPPCLIACLKGRFEGLGEAESTTVYLHANDPDALWQIGDRTYGTAMHSFVPSKDVPHDRMLILARKRMSYLKEKLIADLENPAKIFVLKVAGRPVTTAETEELSQAIRSYGPGELLCVCPADSAHPQGEIVAAAPGVFVGYIDFSGRLNVVERHSAWESLCEAMLRISTRTHMA